MTLRASRGKQGTPPLCIWSFWVNISSMKKEIHPDNFRPVVFEDTTTGAKFLISSAVLTKETTKFEGKEYPLYHVEISSASHPFYTNTETLIDSAGRVEKFKNRASKSKK